MIYIPPHPAPCQSAVWSRSCRRKSGPITLEWRECTSTKGYECAAPPPVPPPTQTLPYELRAAGLVLCLRQLSSFSVPKFSFVRTSTIKIHNLFSLFFFLLWLIFNRNAKKNVPDWPRLEKKASFYDKSLLY